MPVTKRAQVQHVKRCKEIVELGRYIPFILGKREINLSGFIGDQPTPHPRLDQLQPALVHRHVGLPVPAEVDLGNQLKKLHITSEKRHQARPGTWCAPEQCSNPG